MVYDSLQLGGLGLSQEAFTYGMRGFQYLLDHGRLKNDSVIAIVDFSLPSTQKRLFIVDVRNARLLFNTLVSHGRNSGKLKATSFSNKLNSYKTSLGFYITDNTYMGEHGLSLRLRGTEKGINDNALNRAIVMHGADYVNEGLIDSQGYIGRSLGCPAIPLSVHREVINTISDGACLFLYSANKTYITRSKMLKKSQHNLALSTPVM
ncbi:MAG TPA: murein L,D-transpeptidase catalytic domain family protein [Chitinophaga sp.]